MEPPLPPPPPNSTPPSVRSKRRASAGSPLAPLSISAPSSIVVQLVDFQVLSEALPPSASHLPEQMLVPKRITKPGTGTAPPEYEALQVRLQLRSDTGTARWYHIKSHIADGSCGQSLLAVDEATGEHVCVKIMKVSSYCYSTRTY